MNKLMFAALMAMALLSACQSRPDPGKLTPEQQQIFKNP